MNHGGNPFIGIARFVPFWLVKVFNNITGIIEIIAFGFLFIFEVFSSFIPYFFDTAMILP